MSQCKYPDREKKNCVWKLIFNDFLTQWAQNSFHPEKLRATVIDGEFLLSSKALLSAGLLSENIRVMNWDDEVIRHAKKAGHLRSINGSSTQVLETLREEQDLIYLDHCGTVYQNKCQDPDPQKRVHPSYDVQQACRLLSPTGILVATFSARAKQGDSMETAIDLVPEGLYIVKSISYNSGHGPIYTMIWTKDLERRQFLKTLFNTIKTDIRKRRLLDLLSEQVCKQARKRQRLRSVSCSTESEKPLSKRLRSSYRQTLTHNTHKLEVGERVSFLWKTTEGNHFYPGTIQKALGNDRYKIQYDDERRLYTHYFLPAEKGTLWRKD